MVRRPKELAVLTLIAAAGIGWLAASLPAQAFFSGDSGLKLIAAMNAIDHPARPFEVDLPKIAGRSVPYVDPMVAVHDGHGHVLQSPLFPVMSAPLIAALGVRGAYVLPAIAFIALLPVLNAMRRYAAPESSFLALAWIAVAANPLLFYSLEFWEHSPAVTLLAGSSASAMLGYRSRGARWIVASGALGGVSVLLRPEAVWYVAGLGLVIGRRQWIAFGCGVAAILIPFAAANFLHAGTLLGPHASANLAPLESDFFDARWQRLDDWLRPYSLVAAVGFLLVAAAWISRIFNVDLRTRQTIGLLGVAAISVAAAQRLLPRESLWQAFPLSLLALVPTAALTPLARHMYIIVSVTAVGIVLTATHDGGAQWGARFLLVTAPPLIVLASRGATDAAGAGRGRSIRVVLVVLTLFAGLATSRAAYRELRGAKREYARVVSATASLTSPGDVILTNVWWFDQITASLHGSRVFLYAADRASVMEALAELTRARIHHVALVWTSEKGGEPLNAAVNGTCFQVLSVREIPERSLRIASVQCRTE